MAIEALSKKVYAVMVIIAAVVTTVMLFVALVKKVIIPKSRTKNLKSKCRLNGRRNKYRIEPCRLTIRK